MGEEKKECTIKEAAKILKVSTQTVKRKIDKGEINATKEVTDFGERWLIPTTELTKKDTQLEIIATNERQIGIQEIQKAIVSVFAAQTQEIKSHIDKLEEKVDDQTEVIRGQNQLLEGQRQLLEGHYRLVV